MLLNGGYWEEQLLIMFQDLWTRNEKMEGLVFDLGMNFGSFTLFAASLGCQVYGFEMQSVIYTIVDMSVRLSGYQDRVHLYNLAVTDKTNETVKFSPFFLILVKLKLKIIT